MPRRRKVVQLTKTSLATLQDHLVHRRIGVSRHGPRIVAANDVLHPFTSHKDIVNKADTLPQGHNVEIISKKVEIDIRLIKAVGRIELDLSRG